jgi:hypothetical protein
MIRDCGVSEISTSWGSVLARDDLQNRGLSAERGLSPSINGRKYCKAGRGDRPIPPEVSFGRLTGSSA